MVIAPMSRTKHTYRIAVGTLQTMLIVAVLIGVVAFFYFGAGSGGGTFIWRFVIVTMLTDFAYTALHLFRRVRVHEKLSFDPKKLSIVIACYNGEDIIGETIENGLRHVPPEQIIVVSDASTDKTAEVARSYGATVYINRRNVNKAFSISGVMRHVKTDYVLILDDDTLIGNIVIPTSLLDEGYSAVAFNVMPLPHPTVVNKLQQFEYRKSMFFGKGLRANNGAIGNISGAIGLYHTKDLLFQANIHSGQFGGEDQQRTALVHLYSEGRGVTYTEQVVLTEPPATPRALFRQRAFRWNLSLPELFSIYGRILIGPRHHYLLKIEKAYQIFLYITDPFRVAFVWIMIFYPQRLLMFYLFYSLLSTAVWIKTERRDPYWVVMVFPLYRQAETICRIIAHFYWVKIKFRYIFKEKFHKLVSGRKVILEYLVVFVLICVIWTVSVTESVIMLKDFNGKHFNPAPTSVSQEYVIDKQAAEDAIDKYSLSDENKGTHVEGQ